MKALTWQGRRHVSVETVPDPVLQASTDAIIRVTSTAICGSDLHLHELLGAFLDPGDVLGHETMGFVVEVGDEVADLAVGDRVVVPFTIACGHCFFCHRGLQSQCETTQNPRYGTGAALYGYTKLYGQVPGGQAEYLRVRFADANCIRIGQDLPDARYLFLSDILPTAWQGVAYAEVPAGGTLLVMGLGPVGQLTARVGLHRGYRVVAVEPVPERRAMAERHGVTTLEPGPDVVEHVRDLTAGRGADGVVDAVGMESHGSVAAGLAQRGSAMLPKALARPLMSHAGVDRLASLYASIDAVRRGGTVSLSGVYAGEADLLPMRTMFDKQVTLRMGQCNVRRWTAALTPLVEDPADPLGVTDLVTHTAALAEGPRLYETFQKKEDGCIKVVLTP